MLQNHRQGVHSTSRIVGSYPTRPKSGRSGIAIQSPRRRGRAKFGHFKVERLGGPEVDCEFKPARLNDWKIGGNANELALGVASLVQASSP
jgi:hypothetical protein